MIRDAEILDPRTAVSSPPPPTSWNVAEKLTRKNVLEKMVKCYGMQSYGHDSALVLTNSEQQ